MSWGARLKENGSSGSFCRDSKASEVGFRPPWLRFSKEGAVRGVGGEQSGDADASLEEMLRLAVASSGIVDSTVDNDDVSLSKKYRDFLVHVRAINTILMQISKSKDDSCDLDFVRISAVVHDIDCRMADALDRFRKIDFLKGIHLTKKPRVALQKKNYVDEMAAQLRVLHDCACGICDQSAGGHGKSGRRFVSESEVMDSVNSVLDELLCRRGGSGSKKVTPQMVWVLVCLRLDKSLQDLPMKAAHHCYINYMINHS